MLLHTSNGNSDDWRLWLTAAGLPTDLSKQPGVTFDLILMTVQAAIDGLGVAMGRTSYVQDDIAKGRLVVPFKIALPADAGFYLVSPQGRTDCPNCPLSGNGLLASGQGKSQDGKPDAYWAFFQSGQPFSGLVAPRRRGRLPRQGRVTVSAGEAFAGIAFSSEVATGRVKRAQVGSEPKLCM